MLGNPVIFLGCFSVWRRRPTTSAATYGHYTRSTAESGDLPPKQRQTHGKKDAKGQWATILQISKLIISLTDNPAEAFELLKDLEPASPSEYILKGIVHCEIGQQQLSKLAQQYFQLVGESASEKGMH